jgi:hypothetical protein
MDTAQPDNDHLLLTLEGRVILLERDAAAAMEADFLDDDAYDTLFGDVAEVAIAVANLRKALRASAAP